MFSSIFKTTNDSSADKDSAAAAFGVAVSENVSEAGRGPAPVARDPAQPGKQPLFVDGPEADYALPAEERIKAMLLRYFNCTSNEGFSEFAELEALCRTPDMQAALELVTWFKRAARLGDGRKTMTLNAMESYLRYHPERTGMFLMMLGLLGSCKDYRTFGNSSNDALASATAKFYVSMLVENYEDYASVADSKALAGLKDIRGLFFKWTPINGKHRSSKFYKNMVAEYYQYKHGRELPQNEKSRRFAQQIFRIFVTAERKRVPERVMSQKGGLTAIDGTPEAMQFLNALPAGTRQKHSGRCKKNKKRFRAIERCLTVSVEEWRRALVRGDPSAKVNTAGGTVSAISVLDEYLATYCRAMLNGGYSYGWGSTRSTEMPKMTPEQEIAFLEVLKRSQEVTKDMFMIPMVDFSGSMFTGNAIGMAVLLAMIFSMRSKGHPLDGVFIPFSSSAKIVNMGHCETPTEWLAKFFQTVRKDSSLVGYSTNFEAALDALINFAKRHRCPVPDVLSVTDMRVDEWMRNIRYGGGYGSGYGSGSRSNEVFTERTLRLIQKYHNDMGFDQTPNTFVVNCSRETGLKCMTTNFPNGAYYSCGPKGTQVSILATIKAFCDKKLLVPTPWTTMLKTLTNFNEKLVQQYDIDMLREVVLLGEAWFD